MYFPAAQMSASSRAGRSVRTSVGPGPAANRPGIVVTGIAGAGVRPAAQIFITP